MEGLKRKRSPNWLASEKILLVDLVEKHFQIVENKKTDGVSVKAKLAEWQIISTEYNSQTTHCHRDAENLKNQWECMKKAAKKVASQARMQRIQTGGGPSNQKKEDPVCSRIISLIETSAIGLYNPYDKDSMAPVQSDSETVAAPGSESEYLPGSCNIDIQKIIDIAQPLHVTDKKVDPTPVVIDVQDWSDCTNASAKLCHNNDEGVNMTASVTHAQNFSTKDWGDYTPQLLKTPVSVQLKTPNKNKTSVSRRRPFYSPATSSIEMLHKEKIEAINLQKNLAMEEAERNKTIALLDIQIKNEILKQEKLKTRLLLLELRKKKEENTEK